MHTSHTQAPSSSHAYQPISEPASPSTGRPPHRGGIGHALGDGVETAAQSAKAAASWAAGTLGVGMVASASSWAGNVHRFPGEARPAEGRHALAGGLVGLALYALSIDDVVAGAESGSPSARTTVHHSALALAGIGVGEYFSGSRHEGIALIGVLAAYVSAFHAVRISTQRFLRREADWRQRADGAAGHGNRILAGALVGQAVFTLGLGWVATAIGAAVVEDSPAAVTGRFVGAFVTVVAGLQILPHLFCLPPAAVAQAEAAV